jgi:hypothetical protein
MPDIKPFCETCDYFNFLGVDEESDEEVSCGECRKRCPVPAPINGVDLNTIAVDKLISWCMWPRVFGTSWCGEHSKWGLHPIPDRRFSAGQD